MAPKKVMKVVNVMKVMKKASEEKASTKKVAEKKPKKDGGLTADKLKEHEAFLKKDFKDEEEVNAALKVMDKKTKECLWKQYFSCIKLCSKVTMICFD